MDPGRLRLCACAWHSAPRASLHRARGASSRQGTRLDLTPALASLTPGSAAPASPCPRAQKYLCTPQWPFKKAKRNPPQFFEVNAWLGL